jgi:hypothetical protein
MSVPRTLSAAATVALVVAASACGRATETGVVGELVMAPEVETFQPCGTTKPLWITGDGALLRGLREAHLKGASDVYAPTIATLVGMAGPKLDCGFCEDYEGSFRVERVISHRTDRKSTCP